MHVAHRPKALNKICINTVPVDLRGKPGEHKNNKTRPHVLSSGSVLE